MTAHAAPRHKQKLLETAIRLFRRNGYAASGLNEILKISKAPKGSLYYYFPKGKEELGAASVDAASQTVLKTLEMLEGETTTARDFITRYCTLLGKWIEMSGYRDGCPISTILLEMSPASPLITQAGEQAFADWKAVLHRIYLRDGLSDEAAKRRATQLMAAIQGAMLLTRVEQSTEALEAVKALA
ncbi:MAG: TetR/AcrR family transcriptional regulator [Sneathiella sp.]